MKSDSSPSCSLFTAGDIAPERTSGRGMFGEITAMIREADVSFINLGHPLSRRGRPNKGKRSVHRGRPEMVKGIIEAQFDALCFANNHMFDYGEEALFDTIALLKANSIPFTGAGKTLSEASKPVVLERNGLRIGILAYCSALPQGYAAGPKEPGVNPIRVKTAYQTDVSLDEQPGKPPTIRTWAVTEDLQRMQADIRNLKKQTDVILVYQHWGVSMIYQVQDFQTEIGHAAIDSGADAVFGGHQHVVCPIEFYKGKPIVHGSGNFLIDASRPHYTDLAYQAFIFGCTLTRGAINDCYIIPCRRGVKGAPTLLSVRRKESRAVLNFIESISEPFGTRFRRKNDRVVVLPPAG